MRRRISTARGSSYSANKRSAAFQCATLCPASVSRSAAANPLSDIASYHACPTSRNTVIPERWKSAASAQRGTQAFTIAAVSQ